MRIPTGVEPGLAFAAATTLVAAVARSTAFYTNVSGAFDASGRALTVRERGALSNLDDITVRIADVAANLAVLGYRLRDELGSSTFPQFIARLNIRDAEIHKAVDVIRVGDTERYCRLIRRRS